MSLARLLAHYEQPSSPASTTLVPVEFARELARSMRAEKLSARLYRLLPPDSIFTPAKEFQQLRQANEGEPLGLPRIELPGLKFERSDPAAYAKARRQDAIATLAVYNWG